MSRFNLDDYEPVEDRLKRFWKDHTDGRVLTELVRAEGDIVIFRAETYRNDVDERPAATGYAHEVTGSSPVNKTSALENCETSAIGRALANMGYAPKGARPSREEMGKAKAAHPTAAPEEEAPGKDASSPDAVDLSALRMTWYGAGKQNLSDQEMLAYVEQEYGKGKGTKDLTEAQLKSDIEKFNGLSGPTLAKFKLGLKPVEKQGASV